MPQFVKPGIEWVNTAHVVSVRQFELQAGQPRRVQVVLALHSSLLPRELVAEGDEAQALLRFVQANLAG